MNRAFLYYACAFLLCVGLASGAVVWYAAQHGRLAGDTGEPLNNAYVPKFSITDVRAGIYDYVDFIVQNVGNGSATNIRITCNVSVGDVAFWNLTFASNVTKTIDGLGVAEVQTVSFDWGHEFTLADWGQFYISSNIEVFNITVSIDCSELSTQVFIS